MTNEAFTFLQENKRTLLRQYADYLESMVDDGIAPTDYERFESFPEWLEEELRVARDFEPRGEHLNDYILPTI